MLSPNTDISIYRTNVTATAGIWSTVEFLHDHLRKIIEMQFRLAEQLSYKRVCISTVKVNRPEIAAVVIAK